MTNTSDQKIIDKIEKFFTSHQVIQYKKGDMILRAHDIPSGISYIQSGIVRLFSISPEGEELTLHAFKPGAFFPIAWAINEEANDYYYEALGDAVIYRAPSKDVMLFLEENPDVLLALMSRILFGLKGYTTKIEHLVFDRALGKTASLLAYLAKQFGKPEGKEIMISIPFTHDHLASWLGMTRVSISQAMTNLKKMKLIHYQNGLIVIAKPEDLEQIK